MPQISNSLMSRLRAVLRKARNRKKDFDLSIDDLVHLLEDQAGRCRYTNAPLRAEANRYDTLSLDRIDSDKGYVTGNVQLVLRAVNQMKWSMPEDQFLALCSTISTHHNNTGTT